MLFHTSLRITNNKEINW